MATLKDNTSRIRGLLNDINNLPEDSSDEAYNNGYAKGKQEGYNEGLSARTYETWKITYVDGTAEEKEVALL